MARRRHPFSCFQLRLFRRRRVADQAPSSGISESAAIQPQQAPHTASSSTSIAARKVTSHAAVPTSDQLCDQPMLSSPDNALVQAQLPSLPASSSPPAAVCNVSLPPADKTPLINATFLTTAEQFWDRAYDALKTENPKLVDSYEKILSRYLDGDTGIQDDPDTRRKQMKQVIDVGLDRTSKEASLKERVGTAMDIISTAKATISLAIQNVPQASLPWAATCIALEMLANPIESARSSREGISRVIMMMDWYWSLTQPLLKRNETSHDAGHLPQMKEQLGAQIVELYKALLSYQITFVCYCYRHRGYAFLRDLINLDDWENKMEEVVDVETRVRQSFKAYTALQMTMRLEELVTSQKTDQDKQCLQDLWCTDPRVDKTRIEDTKGGLLVGSYAWILGSPQFQQWRDHSERRLLWIKGDPGKGKTMLLCGIIDELQRMSAGSDDTCLAWFFCQATDRRINSATSVLRGLIYMLTKQYPLLISHLREKYDDAGKDLFEGANACFALSKLLANMLQDPTVGTTYLVIDALDECTNDLPMLLDFFARSSSSMPHVKWLISSRNELHIEQKLRTLQDQARLSLELKQTAAHVTDAVNSYIEKKISHVYSDRPELQQKVRGILREKANGTFLWVSLVCQELDSADSLDPLSVVEDVPSGLYELYDRMMKKLPIKSRDTCRQFLSFTTLAFRPLHFAEAACLLRLPSSTGAPLQAIQRLVAMCGSFLTIQDDRVYLIHQSAKDYLSSCESGLFLSGEAAIHGEITLRSLEILKKVLHRDMYQLRKPGFSIDNVKTPSPDPLIAARYSAVYWTEHLLACGPGGSGLYLQDKGIVHTFFHEKFLYWLEALSLLRYAPKAVIALKAIQNLTSASTSPHLLEFLDDTYRFTLNHRIIDTYPLQLYSSALVFSPTCSIVRQLFSHEEPNWMVQKPEVEAGWDAYTMSFDGHTEEARTAAFSHSGKLLSTGSKDGTVKLWDTDTGRFVATLEDCCGAVDIVAFSPRDRLIISVASYNIYAFLRPEQIEAPVTVTLWSTSSYQPVTTFKSLRGFQSLLFSQSGHYLVIEDTETQVFAQDQTPFDSPQRPHCWVWDLDRCHLPPVPISQEPGRWPIAFSRNDKLAVGSENLIEIWMLAPQNAVHTILIDNGSWPRLGCFSHDSQRFAFVSGDRTIQVWDLTKGCSSWSLYGHDDTIKGMAFSHDDSLLLSSDGATSRIWDLTTGQCTNTAQNVDINILEYLKTQGFSPESQESAASSAQGALWEAVVSYHTDTIMEETNVLKKVSFDCRRCAIVPDMTRQRDVVVLRDLFPSRTKGTARSSEFQLHGGSHVLGAAFSPDGAYLATTEMASASERRICVWDLAGNGSLCPLWVTDYEGFISKIWFANYGTSGQCIMYTDTDEGTFYARGLITGKLVQNMLRFENFRHWSLSDNGRLCAATLEKANSADREDDNVDKKGDVVDPEEEDLDSEADEVHIFDTETGKLLKRLELSPYLIRGGRTFSPNDKYLAMIYRDLQEEPVVEGQLVICEVASGQCRVFESPDGTWQCTRWGWEIPVFSPDSSKIAGVSGTGQTSVWDIETGQCIGSTEPCISLPERGLDPAFDYHRLAFSADSNQIAVVGNTNRKMRLFNLASERCLVELTPPTYPKDPISSFLDLTPQFPLTSLQHVTYNEETGSFSANLEREIFVLLPLANSGTDAESHMDSPSDTNSEFVAHYKPCVFGVSGDNHDWVTKNGENILWLPGDYRLHNYGLPLWEEVSSTLALRTSRNGVVVMRFAPDVDVDARPRYT